VHRDPSEAAHGGSERQLDPRERQTALTRRMGQGGARDGQADRAAVDRHRQVPRDLGPLGGQDGRVRPAALLERGDLGLVEDVAQVDAVAGDADLRQMVDREVAERVRAGGRRHGQRGERRHGAEQGRAERGPHDSPSRAWRARGA
jgi:hypothetical protein